MSTSKVLVLLAAALLVSVVAVVAQPPEETSSEEPQATSGQPVSTALETINRILEEDRDALEEETYLGYDDGGRRDPFLSLLARKNRPDARGPRPPGIPGLLIDDLTLRGVFMTAEGGVAQVQSSDSTASFLLREGDQLFDGEVLEIRYVKDEVAEVVFKQGIDDPAAIKPFREVVKKVAQ